MPNIFDQIQQGLLQSGPRIVHMPVFRTQGDYFILQDPHWLFTKVLDLTTQLNQSHFDELMEASNFEHVGIFHGDARLQESSIVFDYLFVEGAAVIAGHRYTIHIIGGKSFKAAMKKPGWSPPIVAPGNNPGIRS